MISFTFLCVFIIVCTCAYIHMHTTEYYLVIKRIKFAICNNMDEVGAYHFK